MCHHFFAEFMLGEKVVVAPILTKGATSRDIYLPKGVWKDMNNKKSKLIMGPKWLYNYTADLSILPYFTNANDCTDCSNAAFLSSSVVLIFSTLCLYFISAF